MSAKGSKTSLPPLKSVSGGQVDVVDGSRPGSGASLRSGKSSPLPPIGGSKSSVQNATPTSASHVTIMDKSPINPDAPVILVLGGPGSGKVQHGDRLASAHPGWVHLSSFQLLRDAVLTSGEGQKQSTEQSLREGRLVNEELATKMLYESMKCQSSAAGFIISGFPKTVNQLEQFLHLVGRIDGAILLDRHESEMKQELCRRAASNARIDDNDEAHARRMDVWKEHGLTVVRTLDTQGKLLQVDADLPIDRVADDVTQAAKIIISGETSRLSTSGGLIRVDSRLMDTGRKPHLPQCPLVLLIGGPGSGRTEVAKHVTSGCEGCQHINVSELLKSRGDSDVDECISKGEMVDFDTVCNAVSEAIHNAPTDSKLILLQGFPKDMEQLAWLHQNIGGVSRALVLDCTDTELVQRLATRYSQSGESRDSEGVARQRIDLYKENTFCVIRHYDGQQKLQLIDAEKPTEELQRKALELCQELTQLNEINPATKVVFVLGGPGSGKGTQCEKIVSDYGFCHLSTGDLLREEVSSGSTRAETMKEIMARGELVPLETIMELLGEAIAKNSSAKGFLIDGFPRDVSQAELFESTVCKCSCILYFNVSNEVMTQRLLGRAKTSGRVDDNEETIKLRLETFEKCTKPVVDHFKGRITDINAERSVDEIYADVKSALDKL